MNGEALPPEDHGELEDELTRAGFSSSEVAQALTWLDDLARRMEHSDDRPRDLGSMRIFTIAEATKLDLDARGLLLFLEQNGILDPSSRELVIERALAIEQAAVSVDELKWVVLLVLMNRPGREDAFSQMEELIYGDEPAYLH
jgi:Smg protein